MELNELKQAFQKAYDKEATHAFFSPGRVNLIGEHTDYNGGHVFPCALSFGTWLLAAPNDAEVIRFRSLNIPDVVTVEFDCLTTPLPDKSWVNYPLGCLAQFVKKGVEVKQGYDLLFYGNVPPGAGLSSSAALEVVTAYAFNVLLGTGYDRTQLALIGQASEHEFAGVNCGIMDQFASAQGKKDHAIDLDCATLQFELVPVKLDGVKVVISNTHSPHHLDSGAYNDRVRQCGEALREIRELLHKPELKDLASLTAEEFHSIEDQMTDPVARKRARHVVGEVHRTQDAIAALKKGDILTMGKLMNQSHVSLRDDYEVTGPELDALAEAAWQVEGVIGSRMTGGGFGGCTVSLVKEEAIPTFIEEVGKAYTSKTGLKADFYIAEISDGARQL